MEKNFSATDMLEFYDFLERNKIYIWIDGGWGVDALLGTQTRAHQDLDIVIQKKDLIFTDGKKKTISIITTPRVAQKKKCMYKWFFVLPFFENI